jgi:hypothetical protein
MLQSASSNPETGPHQSKGQLWVALRKTRNGVTTSHFIIRIEIVLNIVLLTIVLNNGSDVIYGQSYLLWHIDSQPEQETACP